MAGQLPNWENIAEKLNSYVNDVRNEFEQMLGEIVEIPTISMEDHIFERFFDLPQHVI